jgi:hypothetical protein
MLQKLKNYAFQTDFYEILRDQNSLNDMKVILIDDEFRLEYKKSNTEKILFLYKSVEDANSDLSQLRILHKLLHKI